MNIIKIFIVYLVLLGFSCVDVFAANGLHRDNIRKKHHISGHKKVKQVKAKKKKRKVHKKPSYMYGMASYYGGNDGFDGRRMANGKIFNSNDITSAAHPTLPLGTKLKVTNVKNGRVVYVEVKDRMPRGRRVLDVSLAAAKSLRMHRQGIARVQLVKVSNREFKERKRITHPIRRHKKR